MSTQLMRKLDPANPDFQRAVQRAIKLRPQVSVVSEERRIFTVRSTTDPAQHYVVRLTVAPNGLWLGVCNCPGAERGYCIHLAATAAHSAGMVKQKQQAERQAA